MTFRFLSLSSFAASALLVTASAFAHDPSLHAPSPAPAPKARPTTCQQLADTQRYSNDASDPAIKALKARCDADGKAAPKPAAKQAANGG